MTVIMPLAPCDFDKQDWYNKETIVNGRFFDPVAIHKTDQPEAEKPMSFPGWFSI